MPLMTETVKFGTSGLRGLVSMMRDDVCYRYTVGFLRHLCASGLIEPSTSLLVGMDLRASSPHIAAAVMAAAATEGFTVVNAGPLPTPALALAAQSRKLPAIMVTGSHIPEDRNGLKFYRPDGEITKQDESGILQHLPQSAVTGIPLGAVDIDPTILQAYRQRCLSILPKNSLQGLRIGVYQHSSVARDLMVDILAAYGAKTIEIERADRFIPVDTEALRDIDCDIARQAVKQHRLDALISTDGDADRPLIAGSDGTFLKGDIVGLLTADFLSADAVAVPVTASSAIETSDLFEAVYRCRVGSPYVIAAMGQALDDGYTNIVGFEANGGVLTGSDIVTEQGVLAKLPTRDAMLPLLSVLGLAQLRGVSIQSLYAGLPQRFTASNRLTNVDTKKAGNILSSLEDCTNRVHFFYSLGTISHWDVIDGLRVIIDNGDIIHFRLSGNAPELRCYCEASSQPQADRLLQWGLQTIAAKLENTSC